MLLPFVRDFVIRVRRGRRLELVIALALGLLALAMAGAGKHAFTGEHRTGPAERPCGEQTSGERVAVVARAAIVELALANLPSRPAPPRIPPVAAAPRRPHRAPAPAACRVRGPPGTHIAA